MPPNQGQPYQNQTPQTGPPPTSQVPGGSQLPSGNHNPRQSGGSNGVAIAGFVLVLVSVFLFWFPILTTLLWLIGIALSVVGLVNANKGAQKKSLALAGVIVATVSAILYLGLLAFGLSNPDLIEDLEQQSQEADDLN